MCTTTDGTPCPCSETPSPTTKRRTCATPGCTRIASGGAKHCRTCRAEKPLRDEMAKITEAHDRIGADWARATDCIDATHEILDGANVSRAHHLGGGLSLEGRVEALVRNRDTVVSLYTEVVIKRDEAVKALGLAHAAAKGQEERLRRMLVDSEQATRAADEHVAVLKRDRDEAANENCAWLSLGSVTPGDWDGGADEWFRSFSLWVEGGARLEDWTDESGEGTVIGIVSSMARERDAAVKELGDRVYLLTIERDEAVKALGVSRGVVRGQKERLRRAKAEIATTLDRLQAAHGERDSATATVRHLTEQVGALTIDLDEWRTAHDAIDGMHTVALKERDDWRKVAEENADERREVRAESDALRLRLRIMYAVAALLGVAAVAGGVL